MKRSQLNAISRAYSRKQKQEWMAMEKIDPTLWKEINERYAYTRVKIVKFNERIKNK